MITPHRLIIVLIMLLTIMLFATGCAGDAAAQDGYPGPPTATAVAVPSATTTPLPAATPQATPQFTSVKILSFEAARRWNLWP